MLTEFTQREWQLLKMNHLQAISELNHCILRELARKEQTEFMLETIKFNGELVEEMEIISNKIDSKIQEFEDEKLK